MWKVVKAIVANKINMAVQFDDVLHGFRARRGTGTAIMDINMDQ